MELLKKYSTKKDAIESVKQCIETLGDINSGIYDYDSLISYWEVQLKELETYEDRDLAQQVMDYFNEVCGTRYQNTEKIRSIIRQLPKLTFDNFRSVILHKKEEWGNDPVMEKYLRPATLFGSKNKFQTYLEDAQHYWIKKYGQVQRISAEER